MKAPKKKEVLLYIFFVVLAAAFWWFQAVNQDYEEEINVPLELVNVPNNVVITTELPRQVRIRVRDKGMNLLPYVYGHRSLSKVTIDFNEYQNGSGHIRLLTNEVLKGVLAQHDFVYLGCRPDTLEIFYNYGLRKRVPVRWQGNIEPAEGYALADIRLGKDSVLVYASKQVLDTITAAWLKPMNYTDVTDTLVTTREIMSVRGAKFQPNEVQVRAYTDRMVEKSVQVPVQGVNFPAGKHLQTFPAKVTVTFQVGMKIYRDITEDNFILVVNYEDLLHSETNRCHLALKSTPLGVKQVKITPEDVEFIIEEDQE